MKPRIELIGTTGYAIRIQEDKSGQLIKLHADGEGLSFAQRKTVEHLWERYEKEKNLTEEFDHAWSVAANRAYGKWLTAKKASDFSLFRDSLAEVVDFTRKAIDLRDEKPATYYNACLDDTEKGGSEAQKDAIFGDLKEQKGYSELVAENMVYSGGLKIYATINTKVQNALDSVYTDDSVFPNTEKYGEVPESAMVITDKQGNTSVKYTRDGAFTVNKEGYLVTKDGDYVLNATGAMNGDPVQNNYIRLDPNAAVTVTTLGSVMQNY